MSLFLFSFELHNSDFMFNTHSFWFFFFYFLWWEITNALNSERVESYLGNVPGVLQRVIVELYVCSVSDGLLKNGFI